MENPDFLYHYTSINTLREILTSRSIRFNRLDQVDDQQEKDAFDIKNYGKNVFVSCWTAEENESIEMWEEYADHKQGVRIKLKTFPFETYIIPEGMFDNLEPCQSYINAEEREKQNLNYISIEQPELIEVIYTDNEELIFPIEKSWNVRDNNTDQGLKVYVEVKYDKRKIGRYKKSCWDYQKEWRYKLFLSPYTWKEYKINPDGKGNSYFINKLENENVLPDEEAIFLKLNHEAVKNIEILAGPHTTKDMLDDIYKIACDNKIDKTQVKKSNIRE